MTYEPPQEIVDRYADVLVNLALGEGKGVAKGDVVMISVGEEAKPLYVALRDAVLRAGATYIGDYIPSGTARRGLELASVEQLSTFHRAYYRGLAETIDHRVSIASTVDPHELEGVDPEKLLIGRQTIKPWRRWIARKEAEGRYTWCLALWGTAAMAESAGMSLEAYWEQIIEACFLADPDPVGRWRATFAEIGRLKKSLNSLEIDRLHIESDEIDLWVTVGEQRQWLGSTGHNIPSFEVFTSPDYRGTEGTVAFNEPLHRYGSRIEEIRLRFAKGRVVEASAARGEELLHAMIASDEGSCRVGEVSLTDGRLSPITRYMGETLYDENRGGPEGNFHLALGNAYKDAFTGPITSLGARDWRRLGFNESSVHTDIVSTKRREVTALLANRTSKLIYRDGQFTI